MVADAKVAHPSVLIFVLCLSLLPLLIVIMGGWAVLCFYCGDLLPTPKQPLAYFLRAHAAWPCVWLGNSQEQDFCPWYIIPCIAVNWQNYLRIGKRVSKNISYLIGSLREKAKWGWGLMVFILVPVNSSCWCPPWDWRRKSFLWAPQFNRRYWWAGMMFTYMIVYV